jgi:hypothetical protein
MAACPGGYRDQAVRAFLDRLAGVGVVDDVVHDDATITVGRLVDFGAGTQRGDDHRHLVFYGQLDIVHQPLIGAVDNLVDRIGRYFFVRVQLLVFAQFVSDALQPVFQHRAGPGVERGKRSDNPGLALGNHQIWIGNDKQRRADDGNGQVIFQDVGQRHGKSLCRRKKDRVPLFQTHSARSTEKYVRMTEICRTTPYPKQTAVLACA